MEPVVTLLPSGRSTAAAGFLQARCRQWCRRRRSGNDRFGLLAPPVVEKGDARLCRRFLDQVLFFRKPARRPRSTQRLAAWINSGRSEDIGVDGAARRARSVERTQGAARKGRLSGVGDRPSAVPICWQIVVDHIEHDGPRAFWNAAQRKSWRRTAAPFEANSKCRSTR